jgi:hypothetical protein
MATTSSSIRVRGVAPIAGLEARVRGPWTFYLAGLGDWVIRINRELKCPVVRIGIVEIG